MGKQFRTLEEISNIRSCIGFHFTPNFIAPKIIESGLKPTLGANSSGGLGKEANDKTFISYGLEGVLQLYNRLLHASFQGKLKDFDNPTHSPFVPESANERDKEAHLTMLEGFEFVRQYMECNSYIVFDCPVEEFSNELSEEDISEVNGKIKSENGEILRKINILDEVAKEISKDKLSLQEIINEIDESILEKKEKLDKEKNVEQQDKQNYKIEIKSAVRNVISKLTEDNRRDFLKSIPLERASLSNQIRKNTLKYIEEKRGPEKGIGDNGANSETILDRVDFNEDKLRWYDQVRNPHNTHTRLIEKDGVLKGVEIDSSRVSQYSRDGKSASNGIEFAEDLMNLVTSKDNIVIKGDCQLMTSFVEYLRLVEKYKEEGLLYTKPAQDVFVNRENRHIEERLCMDLSDIEKYEGLSLFSQEIENNYNSFRKEPKKIEKEQSAEIPKTQAVSMENIVKNGILTGITIGELDEVDRIIRKIENDKEISKEESEIVY